MAYNFLACDREQDYLMPVSLSEWLPVDHLAYFVCDAVDQMDLSAFRADYRANGQGAAAHDPAMMVALLVYAYCVGMRSSRMIERACEHDVAFRVITANRVPDHTTIARFRARHEFALKGLFTESLKLCREAGLGKLGLVALDGTKMGCPAALAANRTAEQIDAELAALDAQLGLVVEDMFTEAASTDAAEDAALGVEVRGDETPAALRGKNARRARLSAAKAKLAEAEAARRAEHGAHLAERAAKEAETGKKLRGRKPKAPESEPEAKANTSDPQSRILKGIHGFVQGHNAQAVVAEDQVVVAAEVVEDANDVDQLHPMVAAAQANVAAAGFAEPIGTVVADAGYASERNFADIDPAGPQLLVALGKEHASRAAARDNPTPDGPPPQGLSARERMDWLLRSPDGRAAYAKRKHTVEPVFGQHKENRGFHRFCRRGNAAADSEWKLINATHNLLKIYRRNRRQFLGSRPGDPVSQPVLA